MFQCFAAEKQESKITSTLRRLSVVRRKSKNKMRVGKGADKERKQDQSQMTFAPPPPAPKQLPLGIVGHLLGYGKGVKQMKS